MLTLDEARKVRNIGDRVTNGTDVVFGYNCSPYAITVYREHLRSRRFVAGLWRLKDGTIEFQADKGKCRVKNSLEDAMADLEERLREETAQP